MKVLPLNFFNVGEKGIVDSIVGGKGIVKRLISMGLNKGARVEVVRNDNGPMVIALEGCKIAVGRGVAQKIMVSPKEMNYW